jgi:amino acid adenylation domain-containing protein
MIAVPESFRNSEAAEPNGRALSAWRFANLHSWFEAQAALSPAALAVRCEAHELTYADLNARANVIAHRLMRMGVGADTLVGLYLDRSLEAVVAMLGILKSGAAYLPIDVGSPASRIRFVLEDAQPRVILTITALLDELPRDAATLCIDTLDWQDAEDCANPKHSDEPENLAYVIYTSGSTGEPKGALVTHRNVVRLFETTEALFEFRSADVWSVFHSFAFDFSVWELWGALLRGATAVLVPRTIAREPRAFREFLAEERISVLCQTPSAFYPLIEADAAADPAPGLALRYVIFGGEALDPRRLKPWFERHGDAPRLINMYGITETTVHATYHAIMRDELSTASVIGLPLPDLRIYLLDEDRVPVAPGETGELYISGPGVARGYLKRPALTAERFLPDPYSEDPQARLYRSGDRARARHDGTLEFLGRIDQQVKLRGYRIELGEIEAALAQCPEVEQSVVMLRQNASRENELVAYIIGADSGLLAPGTLRAALNVTLPDYMVPGAFVVLDAWPLNSNGKIDRAALPAPRREHRVAAGARGKFSAPRSPIERMLAEIWAKYLGHADFGVDDNFFELGGHSLIAAAILTDITATCGVSLPLGLLFQKPTIAALAHEITPDSKHDATGHLIAVQPGGSKPPIFAALGVGGLYVAYANVAAALGGDHPFYTLEMPGLEGKSMPLERIEDVAMEFCDEIREVRAEEPCVLMGACAGALVVFEMARKLAGHGRRVELVILIDPAPIDARWLRGFSGNRLWRRTIVLRFLLARLWLLLRYAVTLRGASRRAFWRQKASVVREIFAQRDLFRASRHEIHAARVLEAASVAVRSFVPKPYAGRVALFLGDRYPADDPRNPSSEWKSLCTASFEIKRVPGLDTGRMLQHPNVDILIGHLKELIAPR